MDSCCGKSELPMSSEKLSEFHKKSFNNALQFFKSRAVGMSAGAFSNKLELELEKLFREYIDLNYLESKDFCSQLAETLFGLKLSSILSDEAAVNDPTCVALLKTEWDVFSESYHKAAKGPASSEVLSEFYRIRFLNCIELFAVVLRDAFGKEIRKLQSETRDLSAALSIVTTERNVLHASNVEQDTKLRDIEKQLRNVSSRCAQQEATLSESSDKVRSARKVEEELRDTLERANAKVESQALKLTQNLAALKEVDELKILVEKQFQEIKSLNEAAENAELKAQQKKAAKKSKKNCVIS